MAESLARPKLVLVKTFPYRGGDEEWSNSYHFAPSAPPDAASWTTLALAWWDLERAFLGEDTHLVRAYGYTIGSAVSVWQHDFSTDATPPPHGSQSDGDTPGDDAFLIRFASTLRSTKGRPVYGYKYYHGAITAGNRDNLNVTVAGVAATAAASMLDGSLPGGITYVLPTGATLLSARVSPYITTRTLRRRGSRPH